METLLQRTYAESEYPYICTLSISVLSGIRVQKHSDNIYCNYIAQVRYYYKSDQYYMNITSLKCTKIQFTRCNTGKCSRAEKESWETVKRDRSWGAAVKSLRFRCALWLATESLQYSRLRDLNMQVQRLSEKQPNGYEKWVPSSVHMHHTYTGISVDRVFKSGRQAVNSKLNRIMYKSYLSKYVWIWQLYMLYVNIGKTNCIASISGSMRLVHRENNPNKKPSYIYHIPHFTINWAYTTRIA